MAKTANPPVVFVHGLWLHADSWGPWVDLFSQRGYAASAPGWPGDAASVEETRKKRLGTLIADSANGLRLEQMRPRE